MADAPRGKYIDLRVNLSSRHDLLTQLNQIIGYSEILQEEAASSGQEDFLSDLQRIRQAALDMAAQVDTVFACTAEPGQGESENPEIQFAAIPIAAEQDSPAALRLASRNAASGVHPATILIVDDNEFNRDILARRLQRQGYTTAQAANGRAALEKLSKERVDLVLLDVMMPDMDGYETLASIKADKRFTNIPVIMISAQTELDSVVRCIEIGAEDYLSKPFNPVLLWARLGSSLEKKRLREQEREHLEHNLRSEAALERLQALTQMVAGVAHEINTPLGIASTAHSVIEGRLSLPKIKALFDGNDETREILADMLESSALIKGNVLRAHKLVETFKKIAVGQITEKKEKVNLAELVADCVGLFRINARQAKLAIEIDASGVTGDPEWLGYPGYLTQAMLNFLQNIERYAYPKGQGGKVDITVTDHQDEGPAGFRIVVRDYGSGIDPENLSSIFDPFFTTGRGRGGTGLGLSIVKNIVDTALKGSIFVASTLNHGTIFTLNFPKIIPD